MRIIIPFAPGGINDVAARVVATHLSQKLGKQFIAENKTGAGGVVGTELVANAPPDGYTIAVTSIANAVQPALYKLPYDPHKAFDAVAMFVTSPNTLAIHPIGAGQGSSRSSLRWRSRSPAKSSMRPVASAARCTPAWSCSS